MTLTITTNTMTRNSNRRVPQGRARSSTPIHPLTAIRQPSISIARSKRQRKQEYFKRQHRRLAFAAQREKRLEWVETARDTQRIVLGDGKYITEFFYPFPSIGGSVTFSACDASGCA